MTTHFCPQPQQLPQLHLKPNDVVYIRQEETPETMERLAKFRVVERGGKLVLWGFWYFMGEATDYFVEPGFFEQVTG